jgi:hypothetical protein
MTRASRSRFNSGNRLARAAVMPAAAFAVHQLRYWLAFGPQAGIQLERQGHSYLHSVVPWIVLLIAVAVGAFIRALGRALGGRRSLCRQTASFGALWLTCSACLVAIYVCQELLEGMFLSGHPPGLVGVFAYGGWWSVPAAAGVGLILAILFHGARWALNELAERAARRYDAPPRKLPRAYPPRQLLLPRLAPLAEGWSGRGPPN